MSSTLSKGSNAWRRPALGRLPLSRDAPPEVVNVGKQSERTLLFVLERLAKGIDLGCVSLAGLSC